MLTLENSTTFKMTFIILKAPIVSTEKTQICLNYSLYLTKVDRYSVQYYAEETS